MITASAISFFFLKKNRICESEYITYESNCFTEPVISRVWKKTEPHIALQIRCTSASLRYIIGSHGATPARPCTSCTNIVDHVAALARRSGPCDAKRKTHVTTDQTYRGVQQ